MERHSSITSDWRQNAVAIAPLAALIAIVVGVYALPPVDVKTNLGYEMLNVGESLARNGTFADPMSSAATGPTATQPPLYPLILALYDKILRDASLVLFAAQIGSIFAGAAAAVLLHSLVKRLFGPVEAAFAAVLWLASSWMGGAPNWSFWDAAFTPLMLLLFAHVTLNSPGPPDFLRSCLLPGTLLGAVFLFNPAALMPAAAWWLCVVRRTLWTTAGVVLIAAAVGAPWVVRNYLTWGKFIARDNFGYSFYTSNNPCARPHLAQSLGNRCFAKTHPNENAAEAQRLRELGEPEYDRIETAAAMAWIRANPGRFVYLTLQRIRMFWFPPSFEYPYQAYGTWAVTLLMIPGLWWMWRRRAPLAAFTLAVALLYPPVYYIIVADIRYRMPFSWVAVVPAAYLCARLYEKWRPA